jgi:hypothetical protein
MIIWEWRNQIAVVDLNTGGPVDLKLNRHVVLQRCESGCCSQWGLQLGTEIVGGGAMRMTEQTITWVVYLMTIRGKTSGMNAVCEQGEWQAMERARPGYHTLVQSGIINEGEAERLARDPPLLQRQPTQSPALNS